MPVPTSVQTLDLPASQRFDFWKHVLSDTFVPLDVHCPDATDFHGRMRGCELGALRFIEVDAQPHTAERTPRLIRAAPAGCYKVALQVHGTSVLVQDGRETMLTPGDFSLYDTDRPYTLALETHRKLVLVFPRDLLGLPPIRLAGLTATRISGGTAALIAPFLGQLAGILDDVDGRAGVRLAGNVLDLLATVLAERLDQPPADMDALHRAQMLHITTYIEEHLAEADLCPTQIAIAHHISLRQLHKLFHANGSTVAGWIRERRLEHCARDLREKSCPVSAIGARWGYPDPAHFSRLFKAAYGVSPRDYR
jgi:AraC-like DNA-binding protein